MSPEKWFALPSRCMLPVIFDIDALWSGRSEDGAFAASDEKRRVRWRDAFPNEFSGVVCGSVIVLLVFHGFRIRIGLPMKRLYTSVDEASSDYHASEQLADLCEETDNFEARNEYG